MLTPLRIDMVTICNSSRYKANLNWSEHNAIFAYAKDSVFDNDNDFIHDVFSRICLSFSPNFSMQSH